MKGRIIIGLLLGIFLVLSQTNYLKAQDDCPAVLKLRELYSSEKEFQRTVETMFENLEDFPDGSVTPGATKT